MKKWENKCTLGQPQIMPTSVASGNFGENKCPFVQLAKQRVSPHRETWRRWLAGQEHLFSHGAPEAAEVGIFWGLPNGHLFSCISERLGVLPRIFPLPPLPLNS